MNSKDKRIKQGMKELSKVYSFSPKQAGFKSQKPIDEVDYKRYRIPLTDDRRANRAGNQTYKNKKLKNPKQPKEKTA